MAIRRVLAFAAVLLAREVCAQNLTQDQLNAVKDRLAESAKQSWELGTRAQALTELDTPSFSVLTVNADVPPSTSAPDSLNEVLDIAKNAVSTRPTSLSGPQPLFANSAAGDPPSVGVSVLIANWTGRGQQDSLDYAGAAKDQLEFLFNSVPHTDDGAISHRVEKLQLWSDFVAMVPPFLAYYGVVTANQSLVEEGYKQIKLYRSYLQDTSARGLWHHIVMGNNGTDPGHWSTGNAWAAIGILRVLGTIQRSQFSNQMKNEKKDLINWASEIHSGMYAHLRSSGLFGNYVDDDSTFDDGSSTALLASSVYRLALFANVHTFVPMAEQSRQALFATADPSSNNGSSLVHFSSDGWLTPVVNPENVGKEGSHSPEGQAFVVQLDAAYRDWLDAGSPGKNAASHPGADLTRWWVILLAILTGTALL
ncbi:Six-hairpin glycosidase [Irpex rosettiformis]|uniref:Six-hairpin glycosidase n=1 Tax=Irpex rosettiformis TaxID=378272 RepID=A0ACB8TXZ8_9APHY|nr:Six-hairpin glycosidase [Irpex rosettiformis]